MRTEWRRLLPAAAERPSDMEKTKMKRKKSVFTVSVALCCFLCFFIFFAGYPAEVQRDYGVFLGIDGDQMERLDGYRLVVIEPSEFQAEQIRALHAAGKIVYGYLNIGAIEEYRPYYDRFRGITLGRYEEWPDEQWVNVSAPEWQTFLVDELGKQYAAMGLDGFFLDNADVYYHYPTEDNFQGLCAVLKGLRSWKIPLIINGGDFFVARCIEENTARSLFDGINQESVFTGIDFKTGRGTVQREAETRYFQDYLRKAKDCGLSVYLLEYGADEALAERIDSYCRESGFRWFNAEDAALR